MVRRGSRTHTCSVELRAFIDHRGRKERYGLRFHLAMPADNPAFTADVEVRIKQSLTAGGKLDSPPYVIVYRAATETDKERSVFYDQFLSEVNYKRLLGLSSDEWFESWLRRAANNYFALLFDKAE